MLRMTLLLAVNRFFGPPTSDIFCSIFKAASGTNKRSTVCQVLGENCWKSKERLRDFGEQKYVKNSSSTTIDNIKIIKVSTYPEKLKNGIRFEGRIRP